MSNNFSGVLRVGKDAVTRQAGSTTATGFSGACNVGWGDKQQTLWFNCTIFGDRGTKSAQYILKGNQIWVSGELSQREYEGKQYLEINVSQFDFVGKRGESESSASTTTNAPQAPDDAPYDDDILF